jgi:ribonucleoside-diphosphate reductase alpha chain
MRRPLSIQRADAISEKVAVQPEILGAPANDAAPLPVAAQPRAGTTDYEECLACQ